MESPLSDTGRLIDRVASDALAAPLKLVGYRRVGRTWRRRQGDAIQVVNVQASRSNTGADGRFLLNAGVYFPALAARLGLFPPTDAPAEADCHLRTRPMPPGRSWWKVRAAGAARPDLDAGRFLGALFTWLDRRADQRAARTNARATEELRQSLEHRALPWLSRMIHLSSARDEFVRRGDLWYAAAASLELGERRAAAHYLAEASRAAAPVKADELQRWGQVNGL